MPATPESRRLAAELLAHWPSAFVTQAHIDAIASDLQREGLQHADDIIAMLRLRCKNVPNSADIHAVASEIHAEAFQQEMLERSHGWRVKETFSADDWAHGCFHLHALLRTPKDERTEAQREIARHPKRCNCKGRRRQGLKGIVIVEPADA